ncbi:2-desacetyl-2-hydroxyethyl bacteriochlorophyllide A dehydrogenase [Microbacterium sp. AK009]|uniref:zinc-dependent alcohol dehydrogenase n=1 Tax=Microbacterium sp. AK009 TaxID=2723068 RepID=UPI0015CB12C9|nr:zinc-binding dehydrogenase [Microbacterium sp. AK009]NYF16639.1 2-desacetyl-2-hydroxyethyl bacteriochlorophyllide A dehydrogenase [Microbacterium sp. AK009]
MRALRLEEIGRLSLVELDEVSPAPGEVVVETIATGICGSDIHGYTGHNGRRVPGQIMGHETVGRIAAVGADVSRDRYRVGALVTVNPVVVPPERVRAFEGREQHDPRRRVIGVDPAFVSAFAERYAVPVTNVVVLPELANPLHAALIEPLAVAIHAVHRVGGVEGQAVLVIGGGPIGQSCVLAAIRDGAERVFVSEPNEARRSICSSLGAEVIDPSGADVPQSVSELTGGLGADVAIDAVGNTATISDALRSTMLGGRVCLVGMAQPNVALDAYRISTDERVLVGSFTYPAKTFEEAAAWVSEGTVDLNVLVSDVVAPEFADAAFARLARTLDVAGKVLIRFAPDGAETGSDAGAAAPLRAAADAS